MGNMGMERRIHTGRVCIELSVADIHGLIIKQLEEEGYDVGEIVMNIKRKMVLHEWISELEGAKVYIL